MIGVADLFVFVYTRQTERKTSCTFAGFGLDLIDIERRIRHDVITTAVQVVSVMVEGVRLIPPIMALSTSSIERKVAG